MRRFTYCFPLLVLLAAGAAAQDAVEIKRSPFKAGDRLKKTITDKGKVVMVVEVKGMKQMKEDEDSKVAVFVNEIITPGADADSKPLKLKRTYEKYASKKAGKDEPNPPLNTAILIEKKGDKYEFTADGKPLGEFAKTLDNEFNKPEGPKTKDMLPGKPVKPGETWKIDAAKIAKALNERDKVPIDAEKTTMTGKLVKTYKKDGRLFGVMEFTLAGAFKEDTQDKVTIKAGSTLAITFTVDACIDGTDPASTMKGTISFKVLAETEGAALTLSTDGNTHETEELLPKK
jgi:hypothetical protein